MSSISKSPQSSNMVSFVDCMQACTCRLACFIFSTCFEVVSGCKAQTGCRLDWDSNCHFESDKVLICPPGTKRLDITVDKWAVEQNWQDAGEDKMPSARVLFSLSVITAGQQLVKIPEFIDSIIVMLATNSVSSTPLANIYLLCCYCIFSLW